MTRTALYTIGAIMWKCRKMNGSNSIHCSVIRKGKPMAENKARDAVQTAESSAGVTNASGADTQSKAETARARAAASVQPPTQGFGEVQWDGEAVPPTERLSVAEDPTGEKNKALQDKHLAAVKKGKK